MTVDHLCHRNGFYISGLLLLQGVWHILIPYHDPTLTSFGRSFCSMLLLRIINTFLRGMLPTHIMQWNLACSWHLLQAVWWQLVSHGLGSLSWCYLPRYGVWSALLLHFENYRRQDTWNKPNKLNVFCSIFIVSLASGFLTFFWSVAF